MDPTPMNSETIYQTLKGEIVDLTIKPGQSLSESEICKRFGVSRTPVRTAFQRLKDGGLISVVPYKSTTASLLDFDEIQQFIYLRIAVETKVLEDFIQTVDPYTIEKIRYLLGQQKVLLSSTFHPSDFYAMDSRLHHIWFAHMGKQSLWGIIQNSLENYTRFRMLDIVESPNFEEVYAEHLALFELIQQGDSNGIEPFIRQHLQGGIKRLGERIHQEFSQYFVDPNAPKVAEVEIDFI